MMIRKTIVCGLIALLVLCIAPVSAWCELEDSYEEDDPMFHNFPSLYPYQNAVFYTPKDTQLIVNEVICSATIMGYAMIPVSDTGHGTIDFHKTVNVGLIFDGPFTYTPDPGYTGWDSFTYGCRYDSDRYGYCYGPTTTARIYVGEPSPSPEFPSVFLPITLIIGMLGAIWLINGTREQ